MYKKRILATVAGLTLLLGAATTSHAEQLTTVAVFRMDDVLLNFYSDSDIVRDYIRAEEQYRADMLLAENDLRDLQARRATAVSRNDSRLAGRLREDITAQQEYIDALRERWYQTEDGLLAELQENQFYKTVYEVAGYVAEENGYTLIMDVSGIGMGIFWYSPAIDVTEDIIQELGVRFR
ncbi:MAG: OmpH family outer membrane protein [Spirochaetaceae bacterium]|nr:OmpH family outer membrane protein [Spirochaetaceae bacterium]